MLDPPVSLKKAKARAAKGSSTSAFWKGSVVPKNLKQDVASERQKYINDSL